jgi:adenylate cyclase class IV
MSREIELKVPLTCEQFDRIQKILTQKEQLPSINIRGLSHILKSDEYFSRYHTHEERIKNNELRVIRLRTENDGKGEKSFFCIKQKTIENGVEFNSEKETFVEDADVLRAFFEASGFIKWFEKKKDALSVYATVAENSDFEAHLELEKVNSLPYIEIEYTKEDLPADQVRAGLEKILLALGVDPKKRDSRSWAEILES